MHHLTDMPARLFGLRDRGRVAEGWIADLVLFDPATIDAGEVHMVHDLPERGRSPGGRGHRRVEGVRQRPAHRRRQRAHRRAGRHAAQVRAATPTPCCPASR